MSGRHVSEGDWVCDNEKCGNVNFARRTHCNRCGTGKSRSKIKAMGIAIGKQMAEKSHGLFSADDWQCKTCGNVNWARRGECNLCKMPKVGKVESRTGYGGGFNERENVEYNAKQDSDSDDEFDEFGRKKKKFRGKLPTIPPATEARSEVQAKKNSDKDKVDVDKDNVDDDNDNIDDDDDDEDDGDLNAYKLDSDEDEEEDGDLNKYDLSSDEDEKKPEATVTSKASPPSSRSSHSGSRDSSSSSSEGSRSSSPKRSKSPRRSSSSSSRSRSRSGSRSDSRSRKRRHSSSPSRSRSRSRSGSPDQYEPKKRR